MKQKPSKLDAFATQLEQWFGVDKITLEDAQARLKELGCSVSSSRLGEWWEARLTQRMQDQLLGQIASGSRQCKEVERQFGENPAPELETLVKLHRVLILKLSTQANVAPEMVELVTDLMKPVMEFAKLQEKRADRELEQTRFAESMRTKLQSGLDAVAQAFKGKPEAMKLYQQARAMIARETQ
ncbi:MAG: hypothetical protein JWR69_1525 [Pedosphaera sp.]|nr:hypothetical protein [Pedosphaera sp.]